MKEILTIILIILAGIGLIVYGLKGYRTKKIFMPGFRNKHLEKGEEYSGSEAVGPSIFTISLGVLIFVLIGSFFIQSITNYENILFIAMIIWLVITVFCIFFFWLKEKNKN